MSCAAFGRRLDMVRLSESVELVLLPVTNIVEVSIPDFSARVPIFSAKDRFFPQTSQGHAGKFLVSSDPTSGGKTV